MNRRFLPLVLGSMVLLGLVAVSVPLLVDSGTARTNTRLAAMSLPSSDDLPRAADPFQGRRFDRIERSDSGVLYGVTLDEGLLVSYDAGRTWMGRNTGLPTKLIYPYDRALPRELTAVAVDPDRPGRIAVTTPRELHVSEDGGQTWVRIPTDRPDPENDAWPQASDHFTAVAFDPASPDGFLLGTSFGGFYATRDRGATWTDPSFDASFLRRGAGMYEEAAGVAWADDGSIVVAEGFGGKVYRWNPATLETRDLGFPGSERGEYVRSVRRAPREQGERFHVATDTTIWSWDAAASSWTVLRESPMATMPPVVPDPARKERLQKAANRTGIYVSSLQAASKHLGRHLDFLVRHGMNSIVVDCKEDYGYLTYDSRLDLPRRMGALRVRFNLDELLEQAHQRGIYVIARVLVFKDRLMFNWDSGAHAVWDRSRNAPWADLRPYVDDETGETGVYQREHWTDPFDPFVTEYNLAIAKELESRGVDEIQFDYIRFPTDGNLATAVYRHRKPGQSNVDALESFLARAREALSIPISTDIYGFNAWHQMGTTNGQSIKMFARYVDVISPMFYPNHFPLTFLKDVPYFDRASLIYLDGTRRAMSLAGEDCLIRPYIQAFLLRNIAPEGNLTVQESGDLLLRQIRASLAAPSSGYTLWNASNEYYMVTTNLKPYQPGW